MKSSTRFVFALHTAALGLALQALAQRDRAAGFGAIRLGPVNIQAATSSFGALGVVELGLQFYVSARGSGAQPPHVMHVFDATGTLVRQWFQHPATNSSAWGYRDGTTDGSNLAFGFEGGIHVVRPLDGQLVNSFNGQTIQNPIRSPALAVHRGLAFDPNGDGGRGSFWTGDFSSPLYEIDLQGNVLRSLPAPPSDPWSIYGLAWDTQGTADPSDDTLWISSVPNEGELRELDPVTGFTSNSIPREQPGSAQGGLDGVVGMNGGFGLVAVDQGAPDSITVYRVDRDSQVPGENEALLLSGVGAAPPSAVSPKFFHAQPLQATLDFDISADPTLAGRSGLMILNIGPNLPNVTLAGYPELVAQINPALLQPVSLGTGPIQLTIPGIFRPGIQMRVQVVYDEPNMRGNQLVPTNQVLWNFAEIVVMARGSDSFNADPTQGFFAVTNLSSDPITDVTFDWTASSNPYQADQEFDTDQTGMADRFDAGNSRTPGCAGTYRNGSHRNAGLVFDHLNTVTAPCSPGILPTGADYVRANCGWIGTNPGNEPGDFRTLQFRFTRFGAGVTFEFDCDTDRGGTSGDEMDGLVVTIRTQSGRTLGPAELRRVPGQDRSILVF